MANQIVLVALIFFAAVGMTSATASAPTAATVPEVADGGDGKNDDVIGTVDDGGADDAAPVGAPVPPGAFPDPAPGPASGNAVLEVTTAVGAIAAAGFLGSFFFF